ncbi:hypothetical protein BJV77DRAFT_1074456 [Russula vinacea]|nr:hypothetical protein BJV77DRAFT_1074456 [Russula vinacea]
MQQDLTLQLHTQTSILLPPRPHNAQIYRFDCSGVIVSKAFNYISSPELLGDFLWQLVHPENSSPGIIGSDTTITRPSQEAQRLLDVVRWHHPTLETEAAEFLQDSVGWTLVGLLCARAMTNPLPVVVRVASLLVLPCGSRRTFFLMQRLSGEMCRKPEVFFYERIQKFKEEQGKRSRHRTCTATLCGGKDSNLHTTPHHVSALALPSPRGPTGLTLVHACMQPMPTSTSP